VPIYEFQCNDCGVQFEKLYKRISTADTAAPCPDCGEPSKQLVSEASHTFKHPASQTRGPLPPNTGTSDDWNYDKAIGRSATEGWNAIESRGHKKDAVIREEREAGRGVTRDHLVPEGGTHMGDPDGSYRVVKEPERQRINDRRAAAKKARDALPPMVPGE
jgi:putative FmdB family regulatory protein